MITVNELFSGIGSQRKALERLGIPHRVIGISEIDKYAIASYEAIYGSTYNYGDISKVEKLSYADFWTYSFPCSDISVSGRRLGINENTRSGLLYQVQRLLEAARENDELPKYLMLENVKNLVGKNFRQQFDEWLEYLEGLGYNNYWKVLNAKDYGIPQNRERVFAVSIRRDADIGGFEFPQTFDNGVRLKDLLEPEVESKYYLPDEIQNRFRARHVGKNIVGTTKSETGTSFGQRDWVYNPDAIVGALTATDYKQPKRILDNILMEAGTLKGCGMPYDKMHDQSGRVYNIEGLSPTVHTCGGGNLEPKILETEIRNDEVSNAILTGAKKNCVLEQFRIRKLTPKECWRLMGFDDGDFEKAQKINSNSQLYKQAGNSIVVNVLCHIFENLFAEYKTGKKTAAPERVAPPLSDLTALARFIAASKTAR